MSLCRRGYGHGDSETRGVSLPGSDRHTLPDSMAPRLGGAPHSSSGARRRRQSRQKAPCGPHCDSGLGLDAGLPSHRRVRARCAMVSLAFLLFRAVASVLRADDGHPATLDDWKRAVRVRFPGVPQISTADLGLWLSDTHRPRPVILDVRPMAEFTVGHLPGAIQIDPSAGPEKVRRVVGTNPAPIVVYCSVGWRSSALARELGNAGFTNVANLEGSVFAWANEDRPLEADGHPATRVHPYNRVFGRLLRPEKRAVP